MKHENHMFFFIPQILIHVYTVPTTVLSSELPGEHVPTRPLWSHLSKHYPPYPSSRCCEICIVDDSAGQRKTLKPGVRKPPFKQGEESRATARGSGWITQSSSHCTCGLPISVPTTATQTSVPRWQWTKHFCLLDVRCQTTILSCRYIY